VSVLLYRENGNVYFLEVTTDISERIRLRDRLIEFEKLTAMGKMATGTAHHLNTPVACMLLRVQMMRDRVHTACCKNDLEHLEKSIHFCQEFVRRLLEFSRHPVAQKQPESLASIVEAVVGFVLPSMAAKAVGLKTIFPDGTAGVHVLGDRNQLETALLILVSNSLDASCQGGNITLRTERRPPDTVLLTVEDEGCGISPEVALHLFEPFFTTKPSGKGTGLGLALAKSILAEHGGTIDLRKRPAQGAIATLTLPMYVASA
jgi:signal transduction histidine kinase